jgi:ADP-heptose:LPS heptosyltransferase
MTTVPPDNPGLGSTPPGLPPGTLAAWESFCPPVRTELVASQEPGTRARSSARALFRRISMRHSGHTSEPSKTGAPDAGGKMSASPRVLVILPGHLGDLIVATPALAWLRANLGDATITVLAGPWGQDVADHCPHVDAVEICRFPAFDRTTAPSLPTGQGGRAKRIYISGKGVGLGFHITLPAPVARIHDLTTHAIRMWRADRLLRLTADRLRGRFDAAIIGSSDFGWGAALVALAGIPVRVGTATPDATAFLTHTVPIDHVPIGAWTRGLPRRNTAAVLLDLIDVSTAALRPVSLSSAIRMPTARKWRDAPSSELRFRYDPSTAEVAEADRAWSTINRHLEIPPPEANSSGTSLSEAHLHQRQGGGAVEVPHPSRENAIQELVVLHPVPGAAVKRWSPDRWATVIDRIHATYPARVILTGTASDRPEIEAIIRACTAPVRPLSFAGTVRFGALGAILPRARLVMGPDSGAIHLAAALRVPTLRLFGPTDAAVWGAWTGIDPLPIPPTGRLLRDIQDVPVVHVSSARACAPCHRLSLPPRDQWPSDASFNQESRDRAGSVGTSTARSTPPSSTYPCMDAISVEAVMRGFDALWRATDDTTNKNASANQRDEASPE